MKKAWWECEKDSWSHTSQGLSGTGESQHGSQGPEKGIQ